ncbi:hypothetical protein NFI96_003143 [Prochilodus magdalenae]|nr:hypothetical protein NFI96_003143 [Prochilodus magdalenae]
MELVDLTEDARSLGVILDGQLSFPAHIANLTLSCRFLLYNIKRIRPFLSQEATQLLVQSLVISSLDYCNSLLAGLPLRAMRPLQLVQNAAARLIFNLPKFTHITPLLCSLHWLPVVARIRFKTTKPRMDQRLPTLWQWYQHWPPVRAVSELVKSQPTTKTIKTWPEGASSQLQDCFERTNWDVFEDQDPEEYTSTVLYYIKNCVVNVTVDKNIRVYPNQKPWLTKEVRILLNERNAAFRSGDRALYSAARTNLKRGIKEAKTTYKRKIEDHFNNSDPQQVWRGIQPLTNHKTKSCTTVKGDALLAEERNCFFARYEVKVAETNTGPTPVSNNTIPTVQKHEFAYKANRSTEDAITTALHTALTHLEHQGSYVRMLFVDFSSAFNTSPTDCYDCVPTHSSNTIVRFADDTTVVGLISGGDETAYRDEVLSHHSPLRNLSWTTNTMALVKKAQQRPYFLRILRKNNLQEKLLVSYYHSAIESVLTYCISTWYSSCLTAERTALQRVINTAQKIIGCPLPCLEDLFSSRCLNRAANILKDRSHPGHHLFDLLASGDQWCHCGF